MFLSTSPHHLGNAKGHVKDHGCVICVCVCVNVRREIEADNLISILLSDISQLILIHNALAVWGLFSVP